MQDSIQSLRALVSAVASRGREVASGTGPRGGRPRPAAGRIGTASMPRLEVASPPRRSSQSQIPMPDDKLADQDDRNFANF